MWFVLQPRPITPELLYFMIFAFILTSLSPSDLMPTPAKKFIVKHSLKALTSIIVWCIMVYQLHFSAIFGKRNNGEYELSVVGD